MTLILASGSGTRRRMLEAAGIPFEVRLPDFDEDAAKAAAPLEGAKALAEHLAAGKGLALDAPGALVLGADQTLETADGQTLGKPASLEAAKAQLRSLIGRAHQLHSAAVLAKDGRIVWSDTESVSLTIRPISEAFLDAYVAAEGDALLFSAGAYRVEAMGAQLFERIEGSHFAILGLPLLPLLQALRDRGVLTS